MCDSSILNLLLDMRCSLITVITWYLTLFDIRHGLVSDATIPSKIELIASLCLNKHCHPGCSLHQGAKYSRYIVVGLCFMTSCVISARFVVKPEGGQQCIFDYFWLFFWGINENLGDWEAPERITVHDVTSCMINGMTSCMIDVMT